MQNYIQKEKKVMMMKCPKCGYSELQEWMKYSDKTNYDNVTKTCKDSIGGL